MCDKCPTDAKERYQADLPDFTALSRTRRLNAIEVVDSPTGIKPIGRDRYEVRVPDTHTTILVYFRKDMWRCKRCGGHIDFLVNPCLHLWATWLHLGIVNRYAEEPHFPEKHTDEAAYTLSRNNYRQVEPDLIRALVNTMPDGEIKDLGPTPISERDLMMGAFAYVWGRCGMRDAESILHEWHADGLIQELFRYTYISKYLGRAGTLEKVMRLILISAVTTKGFALSGGPDGTGIQKLNWCPYAMERSRWHAQQETRRRAKAYKREHRKWTIEAARCKKLGLIVPPEPPSPKQKARLDAEQIRKKHEAAMAAHAIEVQKCLAEGRVPPPAPRIPEPPRSRGYLTAIPFYFFETNMVGPLVIRSRNPLEFEDGEQDEEGEDDEGFWDAETPYLCGMLDMVRPLFPQLKQVRCDGGYYKFQHYLYGEAYGLDIQIPFTKTFKGGSRPGKKGRLARKAAVRAFDRYKSNPLKHYKDLHKRSHQEGCQAGVKATTGAGIRTFGDDQQLVECALKFLVWNIRQLNYHIHARDGWKPDFPAAATDVDSEEWQSVERRSLRYREPGADERLYHEGAKRRAAQGAAGEVPG